MAASSDLPSLSATRMSSNMSSTTTTPLLLSPLELYFAGLVNLKVDDIDDDDENDVGAAIPEVEEEEKKDSTTDDSTSSSSENNDTTSDRRQELVRGGRESSTSSFSSTCELTLATDHARLPSTCLRRIARFHQARQLSFRTPC